jgi:hypothetical protein
MSRRKAHTQSNRIQLSTRKQRKRRPRHRFVLDDFGWGIRTRFGQSPDTKPGGWPLPASHSQNPQKVDAVGREIHPEISFGREEKCLVASVAGTDTHFSGYPVNQDLTHLSIRWYDFSLYGIDCAA